MSCFRQLQMPEIVYSRVTHKPLGFRRKQLQRLQEDFISVSKNQLYIDLESFRENMGILGVESTQPFADRLYMSFDLDRDGVINLYDFLEYMDILRYGDFRSRAALSFGMVDIRRVGIITKADFEMFMHDFLLAWSTLTNFIMTQEMDLRTHRYIDDIFKRISKKTGGYESLDFRYFYEVICCDNEFIAAFDYIIEGSKEADFYQKEYTRMATAIEELYAKINGWQQGSNPQWQGTISYPQHSLTSRSYNRQQFLPYSAYSGYNIQAELESLTKIIQLNRQRMQFEGLQPEHMRLRSRHNNLTLNNIVNRQTGKVVFFGDSNWNLVLNMMIGIQTAVKSSLMTYQFELNIVDDCDKKYYFELIPRRFGAQNSTKICKFVDYAPLTFKRIRQHFGINETMYLKSLGPDRLLASIVLGEISSMTSMISQGKSGAVFYTSSDGQYMLKSIPKHEFEYMRSILRSYYYYVKSNPQTLLSRIVGLHKIREKKKHSKKRHFFVIMGNVFNINQKIVEKYDIKGSELGRFVPVQDIYSTKKDLNFLQRKVPIQLPFEDRQRLLRLIQKDCCFLQSHESLDYSILIGIIKARNDQQNLDLMSAKLLFNVQQDPQEIQNYTGAKIYASRSRPDQKYVFSIIDILTHYGYAKAAESILKRIVYGNRVSAIPPQDYSQRLMNFVAWRVLQ